MAVNTLYVPANYRVKSLPPCARAHANASSLPTPSIFSCFILHRKFSGNNRLHIRRFGALIVNGDHPTDNSGIMLLPLFQEMGLSLKDAEGVLEANLGLTRVPFESIRARIHLLQSIGLNGITLSKLVIKRPDVLTAQEIDALLCFIAGDHSLELMGKIKPSQIERLLNTTAPRFLAGFERKATLLLEFGIPKEKLVHVLNTINLTKALCLKSIEEIERMLAFLHRYGGPDLILRKPAILNYDLDTQLIPRIGFLLNLSGGNEAATSAVLHKFPSILAYSIDHLKDHVDFLHSYAGLSHEEIFRIVQVYPSLFSASRKRKLHPRINFLKECGLSSSDIYRFLIKAPLFLSLSFEENLAYKLVFLLKIGYDHKTKELALAMGAVTRCSCKNMQEVVGVYLRHGLTCEDILDMSKKHPQVLQYNHESLEEKFDYLINDMGREVGELLAFPAFLGYKLDGRIKQRYEVKREVLGEGMSINKLLSVSAARFSTKSKRKAAASAATVPVESEVT